jgi:hypothetical protein
MQGKKEKINPRKENLQQLLGTNDKLIKVNEIIEIF